MLLTAGLSTFQAIFPVLCLLSKSSPAAAVHSRHAIKDSSGKGNLHEGLQDRPADSPSSPWQEQLEHLSSTLSKSVFISDPTRIASTSKSAASITASPRSSPLRMTRSSSVDARMNISPSRSQDSLSPRRSPRLRLSRMPRRSSSPITPSKGKEVLTVTEQPFSRLSLTRSSAAASSSSPRFAFARARSPPFLVAERFKGKQQQVRNARAYKKGTSVLERHRKIADHEKDRNDARSKLLTKSRKVALMPSLVFGTNQMGVKKWVGEGPSSQAEAEGLASGVNLPRKDAESKPTEELLAEDSKRSREAKGKWQAAIRLTSKSFKKKTQG